VILEYIKIESDLFGGLHWD